MVERLSITTSEPVRTVLEDGREVVVWRIKTPEVTASETAYHETDHSLVADDHKGIVGADIIQRGNMGGTTHPVEMTEDTAAAAAAMGGRGTSFDEYLVRMTGGDWLRGQAAARKILLGKKELRKELAGILQIKKRIKQFDIEVAKGNVKDRVEGNFPVQVDVYSAGKKHSFTTKSFHGEVVIPPY